MVISSPPAGPRVVVGVDDSAAARWALSWALGEARLRRLPLLIVNAVPLPAQAATMGVATAGLADELRAAAARLIGRLVHEMGDPALPDVTASGLAVIGEPAEALTRLTREGDILVLGRGGRGALSHLLRPSVRRHCTRHARGTVVCVPPPALAAASGATGQRSRQAAG